MSPIPNNYNIPSVSGTDREEGDFPVLPEDIYNVVISKIELRENQPVYQSTDVEDKFNFEFTITDEGQHKGRKLWKEVRTVMSAGWAGGSPSWLYKIFCAVNNVNLSDDEAQSVTATNINEMEGKPLRLLVKQKPNSKGVMKNKVENVMAPKFAPEHEDTTPMPEQPAGEDISVEDIPF